MTVYRARTVAKMTYKQIGERFGWALSRGHAMFLKAERIIKAGGSAPATRWMAATLPVEVKNVAAHTALVYADTPNEAQGNRRA